MKRTISICCILAALILMILPFSIDMDFVSDPGPPMETVTFQCSYFSMMPIGYANWMPIITAVLSIAILFMLVFGNKKDRGKIKDRKIPICICLLACIVATFVSWSVFSTLNVIGALIFALHFALFAIQILSFERIKSDAEEKKEDSFSASP